MMKYDDIMSTNNVSGHRQRLRERFLKCGESAVADYELLELLLFGANPRADMKPVAKELLNVFGSLSDILHADHAALLKVSGVGESAIAILKGVQAVMIRVMREEIIQKPILSSWTQVLQYCKLTMGHLKQEQLRLLFLDSKNALICDEVQQTGTVNHTPIFPREVVKRALELAASSFIMVHNHPSGDPKPSVEDIEMTKHLRNVSSQLGIMLHDHIIIAKNRHYSFRTEGLM
ncbi:MAG: DNA repair protein RadC [Alphaproteobacteria bacterium]|nr:DNA repair protein RadC [Alphaproteobacteria bacterium]